MNLPAQYPVKTPISFEWVDRSRIERIEQVLGTKPQLSLADSMALQNDNHDLRAGQLTALLMPLSSPDPTVTHSLDLLRHWDLDESAQSTAATIYAVWINNYLLPMTIARITPDTVHELLADSSLASMFDYLQHPDARLGADPARARDELLLQSLKAAVEDLGHRFGPDMTTWQWGKLHQMTFRPAVAAVADAPWRSLATLPAMEQGGSDNSPHASAYGPANFSVEAGASVRIVLDVGDWDHSVAINAPGQSGNADSVHYGDLLRPWAEGQYVPLLYTRPAIERAAETVIELIPERGH
jgi:penicillin amidase